MTAALRQLARTLRALGVVSGDVVVLEAPGEDLQDVDGGLAELLDMVLAVVSPEGTLVVPTCTAAEGYPRAAFDPDLSPSEAGPLSEVFRQRPGVIRSHSPTHSVAAYGLAASEVTAGHRLAAGRPTRWGECPFGHGSPWDILWQKDALWLMIDVSWEESPFMGYIEALYSESHEGITARAPFPSFSAPGLKRVLTQAGILKQATWDGREIAAFRVQAAVAGSLEASDSDAASLEMGEDFRAWRAEVEEIARLGHLQAGTARVAITPAAPFPRWDGKPLTGVCRDLYARVLVLSHGSGRLALVTCDLLGITGSLVAEIRHRARHMSGLPSDAILIACTHAHSTPDTLGSGNGDQAYLEGLCTAIAEGIRHAAERAQPARLGWGQVQIRGLAHSRRMKMVDGRVYTTRYGVPSTWRVNPEFIAGQGPIDPRLTVARVEALDGKVLAVLSIFGCHPSVALMSSQASGDFAGEAMSTLETALGDSAVALFANGSGGDVDPTLEVPYWGPRSDASAGRLGRIFAAQVLECLERIEVVDRSVIDVARVEVELPVRPDWIHLMRTEQTRLCQEFTSVNPRSEVITRACLDGVLHTEVQACRINNLVVVGLPGEVLTETGLKLRRLAPEEQAVVVEAANDFVGYIPTAQVLAEGGYEAGLHMWTRVTSEAEDILLAVSSQLIGQLTAPHPWRNHGLE